MRASWTRNFLRSLKYLAFRKWRQVVHHWWTGAHHGVCQQRKFRPVRVSQKNPVKNFWFLKKGLLLFGGSQGTEGGGSSSQSQITESSTSVNPFCKQNDQISKRLKCYVSKSILSIFTHQLFFKFKCAQHWIRGVFFAWGHPGGAAEEDSFSFQPIGGLKVPCFYSFQITEG
jgi:hypothetical protein